MNPSVANSPGLSLSFYNVGSWFRFSVSHSGITAATFSGNNGEILAGKVTVKMDSDGKPLITDVEEGKTFIVVTPEGGGSFVPGKYYYITLIPQTIGSTGYTLTLIKNGNSANCVVADPAKTYAFNRSEYRSKRNADQGLFLNHDYVEMAPGFFWATTNVGASSPEEYGDYLAWGETAPKSEYTSGNYTVTEFQDVATANWGGRWRMPTYDEWDWLRKNCTWEWTTENGVYGEKVTSDITGNSIFLPAAGYRGDTLLNAVGIYAFYWSSSLYTRNSSTSRYAWYMYFDSGYIRMSTTFNRQFGYPIRPVSE